MESLASSDTFIGHMTSRLHNFSVIRASSTIILGGSGKTLEEKQLTAPFRLVSSMCPTSTPRSYPYVAANAFSQDAFGGNPATIVFLDSSNTLTQEERLKFSKAINQPIVVFLTPAPAVANKPGVVSFDIQYFVPMYEVQLCGHGTVAAMKAILDSATDLPGFGQENKFPAFSSPDTHTAEFITRNGVVVSTRKVVIPDEVSGEKEDWFEIVFPAGKLTKLPAEEEARVFGIFARAVGKDSPKVKYIGNGEPPFQDDLLIVLDESENIEELKLDAKVLVSKIGSQVRRVHQG